ncbi:MAG: hypothetical protein WCG12_16045, partial [Alcaligenaceae bacterium]
AAARLGGLSCLAEVCAGWTDEGGPCLSEASLGRRRPDKHTEGSPQSGPRQSAHPGALRYCPVTFEETAKNKPLRTTASAPQSSAQS